MQEETARSVIERCAGGDGAAWDEFVTRFEGSLRRGIAIALTGYNGHRRAQAEDLLQEVYYRLLERRAHRLKRCRERDEMAIRAYLVRLARNVAIDHLRARRTVRRGRHHVLLRSPVGAGVDLAPDRRPSIEDRLILRQEGRRFLRSCRRAAAGRSENRNVRILALAFLAGLTSQEISRRLGLTLSPGSIDSLISRARRKLEAEGVELVSRRPPAPSQG